MSDGRLVELQIATRLRPGRFDRTEAILTMEKRMVLVRWLAITLAAISVPFLHLGELLIPIYGIIGCAALYNLALELIVIPHRPAVAARGLISTVGDVVLTSAAVAVTGGLSSPFFLAYFLVAVASAIRFGGKAAAGASLITLFSYSGVALAIATIHGQALDLADYGHISLRLGFVLITGLMVGFISDRARRAERALQLELERAHATLSDATVAINRPLEYERTCQLVTEKARELLDASGALLHVHMKPILTSDSEPLEVTGTYTAWSAPLLDTGRRLDWSLRHPELPAGARETLSPVSAVSLLGEDPLFSRLFGLRAPVYHGAEAIGDLVVLFPSARLPLPQTQVELILAYAERAGIAIRNAHMYDQAQRLSVTDAVTGLPNHRYFHARLDDELEQARALGQSLTVLMIDLDRFKSYNDSFGHAAGDVALRAAARTISSTMRREDVVTRYGGEEFVAILPGVDLGTAPLRAQEICDTLAKVFMFNPTTIFAPLTASVGWATYPVDAGGRDDLLNRADLAMYMAKKRGRNTVCGACELQSVAALDAVLTELVAQLARADTLGPGMVTSLEKRLGQIAHSTHLEELASGALTSASETTLEALNALAASIDAKDPYTCGHSQEVARLAEDLAQALQLSPAHGNQLRLAAILHDVGKIGVVDKVLLKEGKLDDDEELIMRMHPVLGARILQPIKAFRQILNVVLHHHEWYDGSGYPDGLAGQSIPLHARIVAVCDAYHAMTSNRAYRQSRTVEYALQQLEAGKGTQFDPIIVDYFAQMIRRQSAQRVPALPAG
jgi:diguanylate cyclase (GGDEF)-like protein/putative nucleotidyltransferase with HDIG domain